MRKKLDSFLRLEKSLIGKRLEDEGGTYVGEIRGFKYDDSGAYVLLNGSIAKVIHSSVFHKYNVVEGNK